MQWQAPNSRKSYFGRLHLAQDKNMVCEIIKRCRAAHLGRGWLVDLDCLFILLLLNLLR